MKAIVCEMCNSHDIVKKDGMYICESCGTKYTTEEAKKMMVDISGSTVKIDTSEKIKNMYEVARRAKNDNNSETAAKYYDMILMEDPSSWEASFYSAYYSAMQCKIMNIESAAYKVKNAAVTTVNLIKDSVSDVEEQNKALTDIAANTIIISTMFHSSAKNHHGAHSFNDANYQQKHNQEYLDRASAAATVLYSLGDEIEKVFTSEDVMKIAALCWESAISINRSYLYLLSYQSKENNDKKINIYVDKACKYDAKYAKETAVKIRNIRIAAIDRELSKTKVAYNPGPLSVAVVFIILAIICWIVYSGSEMIFFNIMTWSFGIVGVFAAFFVYNSPQKQEEIKKKLEDLRKEKEELEKKNKE